MILGSGFTFEGHVIAKSVACPRRLNDFMNRDLTLYLLNLFSPLT